MKYFFSNFSLKVYLNQNINKYRYKHNFSWKNLSFSCEINLLLESKYELQKGFFKAEFDIFVS